jgi:hypothetical protein
MIFSKIFFGVWFARKNYEMQKLEFGKCRRNPATSGRRCRILARKFDRIRLDQKPDLSRSARILTVLAGIQQYSGRNLVRQNFGGLILAPAGFWRPDVVGLRRRLDSDDRQLLNSNDRISNMRVRTKSLISENDLRF